MLPWACPNVRIEVSDFLKALYSSTTTTQILYATYTHCNTLNALCSVLLQLECFSLCILDL